MSDIRLYRVMRDLEGKHCGNEYLGNLVTCGECKWWDGKHRLCWREEDVPTAFEVDDFCSYGERMDGGQDETD